MDRRSEYGGYFLRSSTIGALAFVSRCDSLEHGRGWLLFDRPSRVLQARSREELSHLLTQVDQALHQGMTVTGFVNYEGSALLRWGGAYRPSSPLLAWFSVHDKPPKFFNELVADHDSIDDIESRSDISDQEYARAFEAVKEALACGNSYQVNLTYRHQFGDIGDPASFFARRCGVDPPTYAAYVDGGEWQVLSFSPELFFSRVGSEVRMMPMKGTARATGDQTADQAQAERLLGDEKTLAENLMIVDMVRNDLGSICEVGSVAVPALMQVERHRRLLQAVSTVTGRTSAPLSELLTALLPVASVTGAPKKITCSLIEQLEASPRNIYCGIIGVADSQSQTFSVAIRTALYSSNERRGEFGVGSGVVWDSVCEREFEECEAKTDLLHQSAPGWALVESTSVAHASDPVWRERHLARMAASAAELGVPTDVQEARLLLEQAASSGVEPNKKVRLLLRFTGDLSLEISDSSLRGTLHAVLLAKSVRSTDRSLRHKTTSRQLYDDLLEQNPHFQEVLLANEKGQVTEFARGSVLVSLNGRLITPPPEVGCLPSVSAHVLVEEGEAEYGVVTIADLERAESVWFSNAVVGLLPVRLSDATGRMISGEA